jgi:hypothetical protein
MPYESSDPERWGCLSVVAGAILTFVIGTAYSIDYLPIRFFDSAVWKQVERADDYSRLHMIEHLNLSGQLDGITRNELVALLGPSDDTNYFSEWDYVYWLGPQRSLFGLDSEWLVIRIDRNDRVAEYRVVAD